MWVIGTLSHRISSGPPTTSCERKSYSQFRKSVLTPRHLQPRMASYGQIAATQPRCRVIAFEDSFQIPGAAALGCARDESPVSTHAPNPYKPCVPRLSGLLLSAWSIPSGRQKSGPRSASWLPAVSRCGSFNASSRFATYYGAITSGIPTPDVATWERVTIHDGELQHQSAHSATWCCNT